MDIRSKNQLLKKRSGYIFNILDTLLIQFKTVTLTFHLLDQIFAPDLLEMTNSLVLIAVFRAVFRVYKLSGVDFNLELMLTVLKRTVHYHCYHFGIVVLKGLVFYIYILRLCSFSDAITILPVFRAVL